MPSQDIAEYAVMLAVILVLVVGTVRLVGSNANNAFSSVASSLQRHPALNPHEFHGSLFLSFFVMARMDKHPLDLAIDLAQFPEYPTRTTAITNNTNGACICLAL
jgi:Flp pilus assembly pilin Flp